MRVFLLSSEIKQVGQRLSHLILYYISHFDARGRMLIICPIASVEGAELDGFGDMGRGDLFTACQIGDSAGDAQDSVITAGGESHTLECGAEKT